MSRRDYLFIAQGDDPEGQTLGKNPKKNLAPAGLSICVQKHDFFRIDFVLKS